MCIRDRNTFIHDIEVEDHGAVIFTHENGLISTITASTATKPGFPVKIEIYTDKGYLITENDIITQWQMEGLENPSKQNLNLSKNVSVAQVKDTTHHELLIKDFIEAIENDRDPLITGEAARNATEIVLEIYKNKI